METWKLLNPRYDIENYIYVWEIFYSKAKFRKRVVATRY